MNSYMIAAKTNMQMRIFKNKANLFLQFPLPSFPLYMSESGVKKEI